MRRVVTAVLNQEEQQSVEEKRMRCHPAAADEIKRREGKTHTEKGEGKGGRRRRNKVRKGKTSGDRERVWEEERSVHQTGGRRERRELVMSESWRVTVSVCFSWWEENKI